MAWLLRDGEVLASLEVAADRAARRRGLLGRDSLDGALLLAPARAVHTLGMRFDLDVAYLGPTDEPDTYEVLEAVALARRRIGRPRLAARAVLEAERGAFGRWQLHAGDVVEVRP